MNRHYLDEMIIYGGGIGDGLPNTAAGFLGTISGGDIEAIIGGLGDNDEDEIDQNDKDLLIDPPYRHDTPNLENDDPKNANDDESLMITLEEVADPNNNNDDDSIIVPIIASDDEDDEPLIVQTTAHVSGGGNVLQILIKLIPSVFPKPYM